jgi:hypothetical protein
MIRINLSLRILHYFPVCTLLSLLLMVTIPLFADDRGLLFCEDFATLDNWRPLLFSKSKPPTRYSIESAGNDHYLRADSHASASAMVWKNEFDVYHYHRAKWRWKISNVYKKGDSGDKSGDDYPIRVYILFKYDPEKASIVDRVTYSFAKTVYGEYPPHSTLAYVWANKENVAPLFKSPYTDKVRMIPLERGDAHAGQWREAEVDFLADYRRAFGADPPSAVSIAIMNDSDNTGEQSVSYVTHIEVFGNAKE